MPTWLATLLGVAVALAVGFLTYIAARRTSDRDRISKLESRTDVLEGQLGTGRDYVEVLRHHILDGKQPPPPPYPPGYFD